MRGLIYKIVHSQSDLVYVGMTTNTLAKRWQQHKLTCTTDKKISIYTHMRQYGIEQFKIMLIKEYDVVDKKHLRMYETLWINKLRCVNIVPSFNPIPNDKIRKLYRLNNKEKIEDVDKIYRENHKSEKALYDKEYRERNRSRLCSDKKQYRGANKEILSVKKAEKIICECGGTWTKGHGFSRHQHTQKHQQWANSQ